MEAGSDTTSATLHSFILAMIKYPHILKKAQKELDEICGNSHSPGAADVGQATYIQAIMTEVRTDFSDSFVRLKNQNLIGSNRLSDGVLWPPEGSLTC